MGGIDKLFGITNPINTGGIERAGYAQPAFPLQKTFGENGTSSGTTLGLHGNYQRGDVVSIPSGAGYEAHQARILGYC